MCFDSLTVLYHCTVHARSYADRILALAVAVAIAIVVLTPARALADDQSSATCQGPVECCPEKIDLSESSATRAVRVGVVLVGIYDVNEKSSSWTADFYLYEQWSPAAAFVPQTEIVNEIERKAVQFDTTQLKAGGCTRTRRIHSILRTEFNLRTFPFDRQALTLQLSDAEFPSAQVRYADDAITGLDDAVLGQLTAWKIVSPLSYSRTTRAFRWEPGAPDYDYATFSVAVRRHVAYHLSKYFLPLVLIVIVSFAVFWIDPEDLQSAVQIDVTCLLAVVALQFAEASDLPDVSYLTIADRTYAASYVAIALATLQTVWTNSLVHAGKRERALVVDRWSRVAFPVGLLIALAGLVLRAYTRAR